MRKLLLDAADRERRFFADQALPACTTDMMGDLGFPNPPVSEQGNYLPSAVTAASTFTVTATAKGPQAADTACATLSLASTGGGDCW